MLNNIRIVLVGTTHPGNIGAAARAMKNMGLGHLYLVAPARYPSAEAEARAAGAEDILHAARVCPTLDEALAGCALVVGASARLRSLSWPQVEPRECADIALGQARSAQVAVLFGRESSGLSNEELDRCHLLVHIPGNPRYSSLNVAAAVQILAYELFLAARGGIGDAGSEESGVPATAEEMELFYEHLERVLILVDMLDPQQPRLLMRRMKRLYNRARPEKTEINLLRGMLKAIERHCASN